MESKQNKSTKVKALIEAGKSVEDIAKEVGCNRALVYMVRKAHFPEMGRKYKTKNGRRLKRKKAKPIKFLAAKPDTMLNELRDKLPIKLRKAVAEIARKKLAELDKTYDWKKGGWSKAPEKPSENDAVNSPSHYTVGGIETYDFIKSKLLSYELGNVVKYVARAEWKANKLEDLKKARWYLDAAIRKEEGA